MRKPEGRLDRDAEEEREVGQGAQEQTSPASSPIRNPGWLKPPTKKQKPGRKRQPRKPKMIPIDLTQRTIKISRRRKPGGGEGKEGGNEDRLQGGDSGEWMRLAGLSFTPRKLGETQDWGVQISKLGWCLWSNRGQI